MAPLLGSGRAADKRVTNHDGWEFNGLPTLHALTGTSTNYIAKHLVSCGGEDNSFVPRIFLTRVRTVIESDKTLLWGTPPSLTL